MNQNTEFLETSLTSSQKLYTLNEPIILSFTLKNNGKETAVFCKWQSPLEKKFTADFLMITAPQTGKVIPYRGPLLKRSAPQEDSYLSLLPGKTVSASINLHEGYKIEQSGTYQIKFKGSYINSLPDSNEIIIELR